MCRQKAFRKDTTLRMNAFVHGVTLDRDKGRLCAAVLVERVNASRAKSIRGEGEVPWTGNQAGVLLNIRLLFESREKKDILFFRHYRTRP